ncbi:hypothetical protein [Mesorhizobium sp. LjNodule214]|uniref:hypothetical protein n=1 Tax=Mesorhizobium sp. LjNodule214 TaxID=3342252 RepID=UPI003ECE990C
MERFNLLWLEDPIPAENVEALTQIRMRTKSQICMVPTSSCPTYPNAAVSWKAARS